MLRHTLSESTFASSQLSYGLIDGLGHFHAERQELASMSSCFEGLTTERICLLHDKLSQASSQCQEVKYWHCEFLFLVTESAMCGAGGGLQPRKRDAQRAAALSAIAARCCQEDALARQLGGPQKRHGVPSA